MTINILTDISALPQGLSPDIIVNVDIDNLGFGVDDGTFERGSGVFIGSDIVLSAGHVLLDNDGSPLQRLLDLTFTTEFIFEFGKNITGANNLSYEIDSINPNIVNIGNWLGIDESLTINGDDIAYARMNNGSPILTTVPSIIVFQNPNDALGPISSIGYPGSTVPGGDGDTPFLLTGDLDADSYHRINEQDEEAWTSDFLLTESIKGMSGAGAWLEFSDQTMGIQGTYLAGIVSAEATQQTDGVESSVVIIEPIGDVYWDLAENLSSEYLADQFGTQVIVSSQSTGGELTGTFFNEMLVGSSFADRLEGGAGNDILDGRDGFDTAVFPGFLADYAFDSDPSGGVGLTRFSLQERDVLKNIERIQFSDVLTDQFGNPINQGINLISGLGGTAGFGEQLLGRNDDGSTGFIDISSIFEDGIDFFGREFSGLWVNNNGSVTFNGARSTFTPNVITSNSGNPEITPYFADVDTWGGAVSATPGGNSTGSNLVYYDFDAINDRFIVTWDDVGYYGSHTDKLNAFQLILTDQGSGDFDIEFRYEDINWTTGDASGGSGGLGGTVARAGYTAGTGDPAAFFELPTSGDQNAMLALDETQGNTGDVGRWEFNVRSGDVVTSDIPPLPPISTNGWINGDPHISTLDGVGYDFQAAGEFVLLHGTADPSFEIQGRMVPIGNDVSIISAVATNLGGTAVMVDAQDTISLQVGGVATTIANFSSINVGNDRVFREDDTYTIVYAGVDGIVNAGDSRLIVDVRGDRVDIDVRLNTDMAGDLEGLLGDGDGNTANDIALADGTVLDRPLSFEVLYGQYRDDWRVSDVADSLFTYDTGESLADFYQPAYPGSLITLDDLDPLVRAAAEQAVLDAGLSPGTANYNNAVLDFALTGDVSFITSAVEAPRIGESNVVTVTPPQPSLFNEIFGTTGRDILTGTPANDIISSFGGSVDRMSGGAGGDIFVVGAEAINGVRERDIILDYEVGIDSILLEDGASVGSIRQTSSGMAVFLEGDGDAIYVQGDGVLVGNLTFIPENILLAG